MVVRFYSPGLPCLIHRRVYSLINKKIQKNNVFIITDEMGHYYPPYINRVNIHTGPDTYDQCCSARSYGRGRSAIC